MTYKMNNATPSLSEWKVDLEIGLEISHTFSCKCRRQWEVMFREIGMHPKKIMLLQEAVTELLFLQRKAGNL